MMSLRKSTMLSSNCSKEGASLMEGVVEFCRTAAMKGTETMALYTLKRLKRSIPQAIGRSFPASANNACGEAVSLEVPERKV